LNISVPGVPLGDYTVIVYDLKSNGLPVLSTVSNPYIRSAGESHKITVIEPGEDQGMGGTLLFIILSNHHCTQQVTYDCCEG